jgi:hypothetical protein
VAAWLKPGERLAHKAFSGGLGPAADAQIALVEREGALIAMMASPGGAPVASPPLHAGRLMSVVTVLFLDVDKVPGVELVALSTCVSGVGPEGAIPQPCNAVVRWDGAALTRVGEVEARIAFAKTAREVRMGVR